MENILVLGANTRPIACSLKNIGYNVYSSDYFGCIDLKKCVTNFKSVYLKNHILRVEIFLKNLILRQLLIMLLR